MKVLTVSDVVVSELYDNFTPELVTGVEAIFACGDLPPEYLSFLRNRLEVPLYFVQGNHDLRYRESPPVGCTDIHGRIIRVGNFRMLGFSGSRWYSGGINQYHEHEMNRIIRRLWLQLFFGGVDLVISHAPPRHINDREDRCHQGFTSFRKLIERYQPCWFIHGHIHQLFSKQSERITIVNATRVMNSYGFVVLEL
jgi:Icc-related predicted phosphoesterase